MVYNHTITGQWIDPDMDASTSSMEQRHYREDGLLDYILENRNGSTSSGLTNFVQYEYYAAGEEGGGKDEILVKSITDCANQIRQSFYYEFPDETVNALLPGTYQVTITKTRMAQTTDGTSLTEVSPWNLDPITQIEPATDGTDDTTENVDQVSVVEIRNYRHQPLEVHQPNGDYVKYTYNGLGKQVFVTRGRLSEPPEGVDWPATIKTPH